MSAILFFIMALLTTATTAFTSPPRTLCLWPQQFTPPMFAVVPETSPLDLLLELPFSVVLTGTTGLIVGQNEWRKRKRIRAEIDAQTELIRQQRARVTELNNRATLLLGSALLLGSMGYFNVFGAQYKGRIIDSAPAVKTINDPKTRRSENVGSSFQAMRNQLTTAGVSRLRPYSTDYRKEWSFRDKEEKHIFLHMEEDWKEARPKWTQRSAVADGPTVAATSFLLLTLYAITSSASLENQREKSGNVLGGDDSLEPVAGSGPPMPSDEVADEQADNDGRPPKLEGCAPVFFANDVTRLDRNQVTAIEVELNDAIVEDGKEEKLFAPKPPPRMSPVPPKWPFPPLQKQQQEGGVSIVAMNTNYFNTEQVADPVSSRPKVPFFAWESPFLPKKSQQNTKNKAISTNTKEIIPTAPPKESPVPPQSPFLPFQKMEQQNDRSKAPVEEWRSANSSVRELQSRESPSVLRSPFLPLQKSQPQIEEPNAPVESDSRETSVSETPASPAKPLSPFLPLQPRKRKANADSKASVEMSSSESSVSDAPTEKIPPQSPILPSRKNTQPQSPFLPLQKKRNDSNGVSSVTNTSTNTTPDTPVTESLTLLQSPFLPLQEKQGDSHSGEDESMDITSSSPGHPIQDETDAAKEHLLTSGFSASATERFELDADSSAQLASDIPLQDLKQFLPLVTRKMTSSADNGEIAAVQPDRNLTAEMDPESDDFNIALLFNDVRPLNGDGPPERPQLQFDWKTEFNDVARLREEGDDRNSRFDWRTAYNDVARMKEAHGNSTNAGIESYKRPFLNDVAQMANTTSSRDIETRPMGYLNDVATLPLNDKSSSEKSETPPLGYLNDVAKLKQGKETSFGLQKVQPDSPRDDFLNNMRLNDVRNLKQQPSRLSSAPVVTNSLRQDLNDVAAMRNGQVRHEPSFQSSKRTTKSKEAAETTKSRNEADSVVDQKSIQMSEQSAEEVVLNGIPRVSRVTNGRRASQLSNGSQESHQGTQPSDASFRSLSREFFWQGVSTDKASHSNQANGAREATDPAFHAQSSSTKKADPSVSPQEPIVKERLATSLRDAAQKIGSKGEWGQSGSYQSRSGRDIFISSPEINGVNGLRVPKYTRNRGGVHQERTHVLPNWLQTEVLRESRQLDTAPKPNRQRQPAANCDPQVSLPSWMTAKQSVRDTSRQQQGTMAEQTNRR